jgi:hypothetical protein
MYQKFQDQVSKFQPNNNMDYSSIYILNIIELLLQVDLILSSRMLVTKQLVGVHLSVDGVSFHCVYHFPQGRRKGYEEK